MSLGAISDGGVPTSAAPSGAAGGDLGGTYPNPSVTDDSHSHTAATLPAGTTAAAGLVELATDGEVAANVAVQGNDARLARVVSSFLAANATNATTTMAASGLTVPVVSGRKYAGIIVLFVGDSSTLSGDGIKFDFDTSAAATNFRAAAFDANSLAAFDYGFHITALATDLSGSGFVTDTVNVSITYEPSASGNLLLRFAQLAHVDGTATIFRGSFMKLRDMT